MTYTYIEHTADMGLRAEGGSIEQAFNSGAEAMLALMFDLSTVNVSIAIAFGASAADIPSLFVEALNEILFIRDAHNLALKRLETKEIKKIEDGSQFIGTVSGEPMSEKTGITTEVKGATYSGLSYYTGDGKHVLECVLDV